MIYCKLSNGNLVSKRHVDKAMELINSLRDGFVLVDIDDDELFSKGDKLDAIQRFREKYDTGLLEAKAAIEFLREEDKHNGSLGCL